MLGVELREGSTISPVIAVKEIGEPLEASAFSSSAPRSLCTPELATRLRRTGMIRPVLTVSAGITVCSIVLGAIPAEDVAVSSVVGPAGVPGN
jgi:hypothetical protein